MLGCCAALMLALPMVRLAWRRMLLDARLFDSISTVRRLDSWRPDQDQLDPVYLDPNSGPVDWGNDVEVDVFSDAVSLVVAPLLLAHLIAQVIMVCCYRRKVTDFRPQFPPEGSAEYRNNNDKFTVSAFSCCDDTQTCLHVTCCPLVRISDTVHATGFLGGWMALLMILATYVIAWFIWGQFDDGEINGELDDMPGIALATVVIVAVMVYLRQNIRQKLSGGAVPTFEDKGKLVEDCALWLCCGCCAAIQEARQVDQATGVQVECCCKYKIASQPMGEMQNGVPLVGVPVTVHG